MAKGSADMIRAATTSPHERMFYNKVNPAKPNNDFITRSNLKDKLYILDLSDFNAQTDQETPDYDEIIAAAVVELSKEASQKALEKKSIENLRTERAEKEDDEGEVPRPDDLTRKLTRALVQAKTRDQVQSILADVYDHMREWQALAATGDKEAMKVVRKLSKLISRGNRKINDLNKEIVMHQKQQKAEQSEKKQEAKRLELELKEALRERKARERRYLQERDDNENDDDHPLFGPTMAEIEAKIMALSQAMAELKSSSGAGSGGSSASSYDGGTLSMSSDGSISTDGGAEVSGSDGETQSAE
ncbi:MAG: hypothetical protein FWD44_09035 [Oscillospiraceae bacterium]|nr:hypothetical protein [Oscillospiraceae bacterium]